MKFVHCKDVKFDLHTSLTYILYVIDAPTFSQSEITHYINTNPFPQVYTTPEGVVVPRVSSVISRVQDSLAQQSMYAEQVIDSQNSTYKQFVEADRFRRIHEERSYIGDQVHERIAHGLNTNTIEDESLIKDQGLAEESVKKIELFREFYRKNTIELLREADSRIVSKTLRYAGTPDIIALLNGRPTIIDLKIGRYIHNTNIMQLTAYQNLYKELSGVRASVAILLLGHRPKNPNYKKRYTGEKENPKFLPVTQQLEPLYITQKHRCEYNALVSAWHQEIPNIVDLAKKAEVFYKEQGLATAV